MRMAVAVGDEELAEHAIEQAEASLRAQSRRRLLQAAVAHARGLRRGSTCDLQSAASLFAAGPRPLATASALEEALTSAEAAVAQLTSEGKPTARSRRRCSYRDSMSAAARQEPERALLFYAADDDAAGNLVADLIRRGGYEPVRVGGLDQSIRRKVSGDLHELDALGRVVTKSEALKAI